MLRQNLLIGLAPAVSAGKAVNPLTKAEADTDRLPGGKHEKTRELPFWFILTLQTIGLGGYLAALLSILLLMENFLGAVLK